MAPPPPTDCWGTPGRKAADHGVNETTRDAVWQALKADPTFQLVCEQLGILDDVQPHDWPQQAEEDIGFGNSQIMRQDGKAALFTHQLIPDTVEDMEEHMRLAADLVHPSNLRQQSYGLGRRYELERDAELNAAARRTVSEGHMAPAMIKARGEFIASAGARLTPLNERLRARFSPPHVLRAPFKPANAALAAALVIATKSRDHDAPVRMLVGTPVAGDLPPTNVWDVQPVSRPLGLHYDDLRHALWNEWLIADVRARATELGLKQHVCRFTALGVCYRCGFPHGETCSACIICGKIWCLNCDYEDEASSSVATLATCTLASLPADSASSPAPTRPVDLETDPTCGCCRFRSWPCGNDVLQPNGNCQLCNESHGDRCNCPCEGCNPEEWDGAIQNHASEHRQPSRPRRRTPRYDNADGAHCGSRA